MRKYKDFILVSLRTDLNDEIILNIPTVKNIDKQLNVLNKNLKLMQNLNN